ncbi:hypothetical protein BJY52DRAFT_1291348 [Lactarius psammicola]|nr:hypothetical protein BJY52DRAFT_1291348 [Lactarius psammicola]
MNLAKLLDSKFSILLVLVLTPSMVALVLSMPSRHYLPARRCSAPPPAITQFHLYLTIHLASARIWPHQARALDVAQSQRSALS